jgi:hypothetical protein
MSAATPGRAPGDGDYIRGGTGVAIDLRRVWQAVLAIMVAGLLVAVVVTTISAASQNSRNAKLRGQGVPVVVRVTGCVGYGSGIAQSVNYYQCRGTFTLDGHLYAEVIGGLRTQVPVGQQLAAVTIRGEPATVTTARSVAKPGSSFAPYITPIVLGVLALGFALGLALSLRRRETKD